MSIPLCLRPCGSADLPFLRRLYASTRQTEMQATGWPAEVVDAFLLQQFELQHAHYHAHFTDAEFLLVEKDGQAVGRLYLCVGPHSLQLVDIALLPQFRGQGLGRQLLDGVLERADRAGLAIGLHVEHGNPAAGWYLRQGFVVEGDDGMRMRMRRPPGGKA